MIRRRAIAAGITAPIGHTFRATGIAAYRKWRCARTRAGNGGAREPAHDKLYDRTEERLTQDEVERIRL